MPEVANLFAIDGPRAVVLRQAVGGDALAVSERINLLAASLARPANVTPYTAGQAFGTGATCLFAFTGAVVAGGKGLVTSARAAKTTDNITNASFRLWLFNTATFTAPALDQAALGFAFTDRLKLIGMFNFASMIDVGAYALGYGVPSLEGGLPFDLAGVETQLTGIVEITGAYTPGSGETLHLEIGVRAETT